MHDKILIAIRDSRDKNSNIQINMLRTRVLLHILHFFMYM